MIVSVSLALFAHPKLPRHSGRLTQHAEVDSGRVVKGSIISNLKVVVVERSSGNSGVQLPMMLEYDIVYGVGSMWVCGAGGVIVRWIVSLLLVTGDCGVPLLLVV